MTPDRKPGQLWLSKSHKKEKRYLLLERSVAHIDIESHEIGVTWKVLLLDEEKVVDLSESKLGNDVLLAEAQ